MNRYPDDVLISIFSFLDLREKIKCESISRKWKRILLGKSFRKLGIINLDRLVCDNRSNELKLPRAIHSLVVQKGRIIEGIVFEFLNEHALISVMQTITSAQAQHLKHLEITRKISSDSDTELTTRLRDLISLCINLEVLKIDAPVCYVGIDNRNGIDLSQLSQLKVLKGNHVHFKNLRSPNLVELYYNNVMSFEPNDCADFLQMIIVCSSCIEVIKLFYVEFKVGAASVVKDIGNGNIDDARIKMPMLRLFSLISSNGIIDYVIDLSESSFLDSLLVIESPLKIINFDLSVHCLNRFYAKVVENYHDILRQFVTSAIGHPERFCLLKELVVTATDDPLLNDLFNSISRLYSYSFKKFKFSNLENSKIDHLITYNLLVLVDCSPDLETITLSNFVLDKKCLIDIIISRMRIIDIDFYLEFGEIEGGNELNVLSDLYNVLNTSNICTKERQCDITVRIMKTNIDEELRDLVCKISAKFRVIFVL